MELQRARHAVCESHTLQILICLGDPPSQGQMHIIPIISILSRPTFVFLLPAWEWRC